MTCDKKDFVLYAVTDRAWLGPKTLAEQVEDALKGGVTCVQLREKELSDEAFLSEAIEIKKVCARYSVPLFINDNVDVAIRCGANGIHVGQEDMNALDVRARVGEKMIVGVSVHTVEEAHKAVENGADMLGVGAMYSTTTKQDAEIVSLERLKEICKAVNVPVVAIGGLNKSNIPTLSDSGIAGVALVSAIFAAPNITAASRELLKIIKGVIH